MSRGVKSCRFSSAVPLDPLLGVLRINFSSCQIRLPLLNFNTNASNVALILLVNRELDWPLCSNSISESSTRTDPGI